MKKFIISIKDTDSKWHGALAEIAAPTMGIALLIAAESCLVCEKVRGIKVQK